MSVVLGINAFHADAAACVVREGKLVAAVAEERLGPRIKHFAGFPAMAIPRVLDMAGVTLRDVTHVAIGHDRAANLKQRASHAIRHPLSSARQAVSFLSRERRIENLPELVSRACKAADGDARFDLVRVEHHLAHLASSFFGSGFPEAAGLTYDSSGDFVSTAFAHCEGRDIKVLRRVFLPDSLGNFYTAICQFIGFDKFGEEYKVMGLAAYGRPVFLPLMERLLRPGPEGRFELDRDCFKGLTGADHESTVDDAGAIHVPRLYTGKLVDVLGEPRGQGTEITQRDKDLAASAQLHFENVVLHCLAWLGEQVGSTRLVTAGGCALNGVCNARILRDSSFRATYTHCAAGDDGTAVGAALWVAHGLVREPDLERFEAPYLGPDHTEEEMVRALETAGLHATRYEGAALLDRVVDLLEQGRVVGWFQGRSEWGPRALGNRSILAHPGWPGMKDLINAKIKRREAFRPFAPSVMTEHVADYFEQDVDSPFMMHVVRIRAEQRAKVAAIVHEDGTGRLQSVSARNNALYHDLLAAFNRRTGVPMLLNTSFNENEPIVQTPEQAVGCYVRTDLDALVLGPFVTEKSDR